MHTTFVEEERYYDRWRLNDEDKSKIMAKHLRSLCIRLGMMTLSADISDNQKEFKDFMLMLSEDRLFLGDYVLADKKLLGRKSQMCYLAVRLHIPCLVRFVYQNSTRNI
ncbi:MAG: hypothetical protein LIO93_07450 [Bacteroidales bacterium]|nr:hypothetical protein [Bacteroidales bacterium]MCC8152760.1 hypothetical protein [Tannerellaceae bacterium]